MQPMQTYRLTVEKFLDHAASWFGHTEVVSAESGTGSRRINYSQLHSRTQRLSGALAALGLNTGDRVGTLAWNTQHHLEMYYASMNAGFVCHTLNPRFNASHLASVINEAGTRTLAVAASLQPLLTELLALCPSIHTLIFLDDRVDAFAFPSEHTWNIDELIERLGTELPWNVADENAAAGLCYTSGTTGKPKGVLYTHRSNYLHTLRLLQADAFALRSDDCVLVAVPMFHANGWGLPFAAPAVGAKLVLPGRNTDGASLARLIREEGVTIAAGVQTVWLGLLDHLDASGESLPSLQRIVIGGSNCPDALIHRMEERLDVEVQTSWGMTELSPLGTIAAPGAGRGTSRSAGRPLLGLDLKLTDSSGIRLPQQRDASGHLWVRGASVVSTYFGHAEPSLDEEGFFNTGDLAEIDARGQLTICGRSKDLIKSGGEWINPAEIEKLVGLQPSVGLVAVIGRKHPKWGERPVLIVEPSHGHQIDPDALLAGLKGKIESWWIPDQVIQLDRMPLAATGKIDKQRLRLDYMETFDEQAA